MHISKNVSTFMCVNVVGNSIATVSPMIFVRVPHYMLLIRKLSLITKVVNLVNNRPNNIRNSRFWGGNWLIQDE
jgi:hypothetical protein